MRLFTRSDGLALLAVAIFAGTYPATKVAIAGGLSPVANGVLRTCIAGLCAAVALALLRIAPPRREQWRATLLIGGGTLLFPCGVGWAVAVLPAGQVGVAMALLPLATVLYAAVRGEPLPGWRFWLAGTVAALIVAVFAARHAQAVGGESALLQALLAVGLAMAAGAVTYVEGGRLARTRPAWQVISWGLVACLPVTLTCALGWLAWAELPTLAGGIGLLYGGIFSAWIGFFPWFAAIAALGAARAGQMQYLQPFLALGYGVVLLNEGSDGWDLLCAVAVVAVIAWGRAQIARPPVGVSQIAGGSTLLPCPPSSSLAAPATSAPIPSSNY